MCVTPYTSITSVHTLVYIYVHVWYYIDYSYFYNVPSVARRYRTTYMGLKLRLFFFHSQSKKQSLRKTNCITLATMLYLPVTYFVTVATFNKLHEY